MRSKLQIFLLKLLLLGSELSLKGLDAGKDILKFVLQRYELFWKEILFE
jgi:hypothetical protein